jgi:hypothetical protein
MMDCTQALMATQVIIRLAQLEHLPQVILHADAPLVQMTIDGFRLQWEIVREDREFTTVRRLPDGNPSPK